MEDKKIINSFPGYEFVMGDDNKMHNMYRETDLGFGGYVYAEPGIYSNVALIDIQSMHPSSIIALNYFGEYTNGYKDLLDTRVLIKHKQFDEAKKKFGGRLSKYLDDPAMAKSLSQAMKLCLNSCYGLTSANFDNPMRDIRNKNNIVALRGALFMRTLQDEVQSRGFTICHIKTDSMKIVNATPEIIDFCMEFARRYGYVFEHEATYDRMCLVNDAVYIAKYSDDAEINGDNAGKWTATGTQFQVPYVFKKLFSKEPIEFKDMCETKSVNTSMYLDMNEGYPDVSEYENIKTLRSSKKKLTKAEVRLLDEYANYTPEQLDELVAPGHNYVFVGKVGQFCPIKDGCNGGILCRESKDGDGNLKYTSATGAAGYRWLESELVKELGKEDDIDKSYYNKLVDAAIDEISKYGDFEMFVSEDGLPNVEPEQVTKDLPWKVACGRDTCIGCENFTNDEYHVDCMLGHDISDMASVLNKIQKD